MLDQEQLSRFRELVINDVKGPQDKDIFLYLHEDMSLWLYTLRTLRREVELQISCQNAKLKMDISNLMSSEESDEVKQTQVLEYNARHQKWKMSVLKFLTNIENKILYVKMIISNNDTLTMEAS